MGSEPPRDAIPDCCVPYFNVARSGGAGRPPAAGMEQTNGLVRALRQQRVTVCEQQRKSTCRVHFGGRLRYYSKVPDASRDRVVSRHRMGTLP